MQRTDNIRIAQLRPLISPALLMEQLPITEKMADVITQSRQEISDILHGKDNRLVVVVGPCSIHDPVAALDYAQRLRDIAHTLKDNLCIIMRVYFEKPRTTVGWKGLINDPYLDSGFNINEGLHVSRKLLLDINALGLPTGSEYLDTIIPQYISDLTSWSAIGARTTESQIHRELASGLSMPVGFKNGTGGSIKIALEAAYAASHEHHFLSVTKQGIAAIVSTTGNKDCHIILRGSTKGPNYDAETIKETVAMLEKRELAPRLMVDCSHGNSNKDHEQQINVITDMSERIAAGDHSIFGVMVESNIKEGNQSLIAGTPLEYGKSVTDACINWENTEAILKKLSDAVAKRGAN